MIDASSLEQALSADWGIRVRAVVTDRLFDLAGLTPAESLQLTGLSNAARQESWLRGRRALKALLRGLGERDDTSLLRFPHPRISLSHSGSWAVALGTDAPVAGLGVDLELREPPKPEVARFFLAPEEIPWLKKAAPRTLLRFWTVKEATFKADPQNAFTSVRAYRLDDPDALSGTVSTGAKTFRYRSFEVPGGFLTAALLPSVERDAARK